jgi:dipeptidyl aminopeptidase/acylaminoacyl peptidase
LRLNVKRSVCSAVAAGLLVISTTSAAKPPLDVSVLGNWPVVGEGSISDSGQYVVYRVRAKDEADDAQSTVVLQATNGKWKLDLPGSIDIGSMAFVADNLTAVFLDGDRMGIANLRRAKVAYTTRVRSFRFLNVNERGWLLYELDTPKQGIVLRELASGMEITFPNATDSEFGGDGNLLLLQTESKEGGATGSSLSWFNLNNGKHSAIWHGDRADRFARGSRRACLGRVASDGWILLQAGPGAPMSSLRWVHLLDGQEKLIWKGSRPSSFVMDLDRAQMAFAAEEPREQGAIRSLWYYKVGAEKATIMPLASELRLDAIQRFSADGERLFLTLRRYSNLLPVPNPDLVKVRVWNYKDVKLQSEQRADLISPPNADSYKAIIWVSNFQVILLNPDAGERIDFPRLRSSPEEKDQDNDFTILSSTRSGGAGEEIWNSAFRFASYLVSMRDGSRRLLPPGAQLSPGGGHVVYYDEKQDTYFSYETSSGTTQNITPGKGTRWKSYQDDDLPGGPRGIAGWLSRDSGVLIYDRNDIWQIDFAGAAAPLNLTNGYGRSHDIVFSLLDNQSRRTYRPGERLVLSAFNMTNKDNGFYSKVLGQGGEPTYLTMGPYVFCCTWREWFESPSEARGISPIKARDAEIYLVQRMSVSEAPNYFSTSDFKKFTPLSKNYPERLYNWGTSELHDWRTPDGTQLQGILYKPEDFDSKKQYPLVFQIYEKKSDALNAYIVPAALEGGCNFNIAWYMSRGYLVFAPDIYTKAGHPGESAVDSVVSAVKHLSKNHYVDTKRMGVQGCSYGGFETNYLVAHTKLFAAAVTASGATDFISNYGELRGGGPSQQGVFEQGQYRIMETLWERPDLYIENSPVMRADDISTPLLQMHTSSDGAVPFSQAVELFTALRRLKKKAWMLEYEDGNHALSGRSADDFSVRMAQFFDHYLKDAPPPKWMTDGVPARLGGIETGLEWDISGTDP